ncbi:MAG: hypothetical protein HWE22_10535 [Flavobacteriales bacterium]|nr:hypothetical protein [Flavobacteriales bacterium]
MYKTLSLLLFVGISIFSSVNAQDAELEVKTLLNDRVELKIPTSFNIMSEEVMKLKYPSERRPEIVYSDESGGINVGVSFTDNQASQDDLFKLVETFEKTFSNVYPSAEWFGFGIQYVNDRKVGYIEFITPAIDTEIYNLMFFTDLDGKLLICTFNCTRKSIEEWSGTAHEILNSLNIL